MVGFWFGNWYNNLHLVPQLKSLHRKIEWRAYFLGHPVNAIFIIRGFI